MPHNSSINEDTVQVVQDISYVHMWFICAMGGLEKIMVREQYLTKRSLDVQERTLEILKHQTETLADCTKFIMQQKK